MIHTITFRVAAADALDFWEARLGARGCRDHARRRAPAVRRSRGARARARSRRDRRRPARRGNPEIPAEHALQGFDGVRAFASAPERAARCSRTSLGFESRGEATWELRGAARGGMFGYDPPPASGPGIPGAGTVHHVAWSSTMADHEAWQRRIAEAGVRPTPVIDRFWFRSIYFREPSGVLFEVATLGPGFGVDEDATTSARRSSCRRPSSTSAPRSSRCSRRSTTRARTGREASSSSSPRAARGRRARRARSCCFTAEAPTRTISSASRRARPRAATARDHPGRPLALPPGGRHWYRLGGIPTPDPETFRTRFDAARSFPRLAARADESRRARRVLAGSRDDMGDGLGPGRPRPAAIIALSGFLPEVPGLRARPRASTWATRRGRARLARPRDPGRRSVARPPTLSRRPAPTSRGSSRRCRTRSTRRGPSRLRARGDRRARA